MGAISGGGQHEYFVKFWPTTSSSASNGISLWSNWWPTDKSPASFGLPRDSSGDTRPFTSRFVIASPLEKPEVRVFNYAATRAELCELAVRGLKAITGYDRVMAYRFGADGHGEVIAEAREAQLEPYLGLRYPATDVPLPA